MRTHSNYRTVLVSSLLVVLLALGAGAAEEYTTVFDQIRVFQEGKDIDLLFAADGDTFSVSLGKTSAVGETEFMTSLEKGSDVQVKILAGRKEAYSYYMGPDQRLRAIIDGTGASKCDKTVFTPLGRFPLGQWQDFLRKAIPKGLTYFARADDEAVQQAWVFFRQIGPANVKLGKETLKLSEEFYRQMRLSRWFKPNPGTTGRFVVFIHEPHWCIPGQHQLIYGTKALLDGNPEVRFRFLVEGYFEDETKNIPTGPTLGVLVKGAPVSDQVYALVRQHLIDGPFAFRLIYSPDLSATAIDDAEEIRATHAETDGDVATVYKRGFTLMKRLEQQPDASTQDLREALAKCFQLLGADIEDLRGTEGVHYYEDLGEHISVTRRSLNRISGQDVTEFSSSLDTLSEHCKNQVSVLRHALNRDVIMARNIARCLETSSDNEILVAYIGSFHTQGIINALPPGTGYVVLEPRMQAEQGRYDADFVNLLRPEGRLDVLHRVSRTLKLPVAPFTRELQDYGAFLKKSVTNATARENAFKTSSPISAEVRDGILAAVKKNVVLSGAGIGFGGDAPPPVKGAFATFPAEPGREPALLLLDRDEEKWKRHDRLAFLASVLPLVSKREDKGRILEVTFYQDADTSNIFFCIYRQEDHKYYLCEWPDHLDMSEALALPKGIIHLLLGREPKDEENCHVAQG